MTVSTREEVFMSLCPSYQHPPFSSTGFRKYSPRSSTLPVTCSSLGKQSCKGESAMSKHWTRPFSLIAKNIAPSGWHTRLLGMNPAFTWLSTLFSTWGYIIYYYLASIYVLSICSSYVCYYPSHICYYLSNVCYYISSDFSYPISHFLSSISCLLLYISSLLS